MKNSLQMYLFNPITGEKTKTSYEYLTNLLGKTKSSLKTYRFKKLKLKEINCYIIDERTTNKQLHEFVENEKIYDEIWKDIKFSCGKYKVSSYGRIKRKYNEHEYFIIPFEKKDKRMYIKMTINNISKQYAVHKLVATHFLKNPNNYSNVIHKNFNVKENHRDNLQWVNRDVVMKYAHNAINKKWTRIYKIDPITMEIIDEYDSVKQAAKENYTSHTCLWNCLNGMHETAIGYKWRIANNENIKNSKSFLIKYFICLLKRRVKTMQIEYFNEIKHDLHSIIGKKITDVNGNEREILAVVIQSKNLNTNIWMILNLSDKASVIYNYYFSIKETTKYNYWREIKKGKEKEIGCFIKLENFNLFNETKWIYDKYKKEDLNLNNKTEKIINWLKNNINTTI